MKTFFNKVCGGVFLLLLMAQSVIAQVVNAPTVPNITRIEWYIDIDPGFGNATPLSFTPGTNIANATIPIDPATITSGVHVLYARAQDANGGWSLTNRWLFYKPYGAGSLINAPATPNITRIEWYIDIDPGFGNANTLAITPGTDIADAIIPIDPATLTSGVHVLYARALDANGAWSLTNRWLFYKPYGAGSLIGAPATPNITRIEWYIDNDPGFGNANALGITPGTNIADAIISIDPNTLTSGVHLLFARAQDANGGWSLTNRWLFYKPYGDGTLVQASPIPNLVALEYYIDTDPGLGMGKPVAIPATTDISGLNLSVNVSTLAEGAHKLHLRGKDANGSWSMVNTLNFTIPTAITGNSIMVTGVDKTTICAADLLNVSYDAQGSYTSGNMFKVFLSNATGDFTSEVEIGSVTTTEGSGIINCVLPANTPPGNGYRVRVKSTTPAIISAANTQNITINASAAPSVSIAAPNNGSTCVAGNIQFSATPTNGGQNPAYEWQVNNVASGTGPNFSSNSLQNGDIIKVIMTSSAACAIPASATSNSITVSLPIVIPTISISVLPTGTTCTGQQLQFTANTTNGGSSPSIAWKVNSTIVQYGATYSPSNLANGDVVTATLTSSDVCAQPASANSNSITVERIATQTYYRDADGDGFGNPNMPFESCNNPQGYVTNNTDCNDGNFYINPNTTWYKDLDNDGYGDGNPTGPQCNRPVGYKYAQELFTTTGDCNDNDASVGPARTWYKDADNDGYSDGTTVTQCARPTGYKLPSELIGYNDCDDTNAEINIATVWYKDLDNDGYTDGVTITQCTRPTGYKLASELTGVGTDCNDNDPNATITQTWYKDADNDGYSDGTSQSACTRPTGYKLASELTATSGDCDDTNATLNPATVWYKDADNDGYSDGTTQTQCVRPTGYKLASELTATSGDCNDNDANLNPTTVWYKDADNDGYSDGTTLMQCVRPTGYKLASELTATSGDCNDNNAVQNPTTVWYKDADNDGYSDGTQQTQCVRPTGYKLASELTATSGDCDDSNAALNPATVWYKDADNDGYSDGTTQTQCARPTGFKLASELTATSGDCDDSNAMLNPATVWFKDADNDGYSDGTQQTQCVRPTGYKLASELTATSGDCNDNNAALNPTTVWYKDADNDGYSDGTTQTQCNRPTGYKLATELTATSGDCNDADAAVNPGATEICGNGKDDDCNPATSDVCTLPDADNDGVPDVNDCAPNDATRWRTANLYIDGDNDGYDAGQEVVCYGAAIPAGYKATTLGTDCDDTNAAITVPRTWYQDSDNDGYSNGTTLTQCNRPAGYKLASELTATSGDCDDSNATLNPATVWYKDADNDGYSDGTTQTQCARPTGYKLATELTATSGDCDDSNATLNPETVWYKDADNDGYSDGTTQTQCARPTGYKLASELTATSGDCDDSNAALNPATVWYKDADNDGYSDGTTQTQCARPTGYKLASELTATSGDCDDSNAALNPATVWYKDVDNDGYSDGTTQTQCNRPTGYKLASELTATSGDCNDNNAALNPTTVWYKDADNDGYSDGTTQTQCNRPTGYKLATELTATSGDCNDADAAVNPGATEICGNGKDDDCNPATSDVCTLPDADNDGVPDVNDCAPNDATRWRTANLYIDGDNDGYDAGQEVVCYGAAIPAGYKATTLGTDCDDTNAAITVPRTWYQDSDNDGYSNGNTLTQCNRPTGYKLASELTATSGDCDDSNATLNPATVWYKDADNDGYSDGTTQTQCVRPTGYKLASELTASSGDCDDSNPALNPATVWFKDTDNDGYSDGTQQTQCARPTGFKLASELTATSGDCDDSNAALNPATVWYKDADNDGYSDGTTQTQCARPTGFKLASELTATSGDCDDSNAMLNPATVWFKDADNDGYSDGTTLTQCGQPTGYKLAGNLTATTGDCRDNDATVFPGAPELCDGKDNDCDGTVDEGCETGLRTWYRDRDGDGFGKPNQRKIAVLQPRGYVANADDCNDNNPNVYPGAPELPDGLDNDCDGQIDEGLECRKVWYRDVDGDGYGKPNLTRLSCVQPQGYVDNADDCNDNDATIYPGAPELPDGIDNNCDGQIDEGMECQKVWYRDVDGDGYGKPNLTRLSCLQPRGYVDNADDCNDNDATVYPGAPELPDGIDNNCDGQIDEGMECQKVWYRDVDGDGYGKPNLTRLSCMQPRGYVDNANDCNDNDATVYPGAPELPDGLDNDCDGQIDEGLDCQKVWYRDVDGDGYGKPNLTRLSCMQPQGYVNNANDCNDNDATVYPGAPELCDGKDNDCDGVKDEDCGTSPIIVKGGNTNTSSKVEILPASLRIWPNPARDQLMVVLEGFETGKKAEIVMLTLDGRSVQSQTVMPVGNSLQVPMRVDKLMAGYYLLQVKQGAQIKTKQVIIAR
jgi:hypothetical protein